LAGLLDLGRTIKTVAFSKAVSSRGMAESLTRQLLSEEREKTSRAIEANAVFPEMFHRNYVSMATAQSTYVVARAARASGRIVSHKSKRPEKNG
jgi:hypothetical protein